MVSVQNLQPINTNTQVSNDQHQSQSTNTTQDQRRNSPENIQYFKPGFIPHDAIRYVQRMNSISEDEEQNTSSKEDIKDPCKKMTGIPEVDGRKDTENIQPENVPQDESKDGQDIQNGTKSIQEEENIQDSSKNVTDIPKGEELSNKEKNQDETPNGQTILNRTKSISEDDRQNNKEKSQSQPERMTNIPQYETLNGQDHKQKKILAEDDEQNGNEKNKSQPDRMTNISQDETPNDQDHKQKKIIPEDDGQNGNENIHPHLQRMTNISKDETPNGQIIENRKKSISEDGENGKEKESEVDYDELLSSAGEFGRYQILLFISTFPFYWFGVFAYFSQLFMTEVSPNHWCWVPELANLTDVERRGLAIPPDDSSLGYSRCRQYAVANWSEVLSQHVTTNSSWDTKPCDRGWEFNLTEIPYPTAASELSWVCERDSYQATAQSVFFVGSIVGGFLVGWIADRFGRVPAAVSSNLIGCVAGVASVFSTNFAQFAASRFFLGMSYDNCMMMTYLLVLEYVAPKYRSLIANLPFALFYTSGLIALPWIALACGHWRTLGLATSVPMALALLAPFIIPESPRWLLSKGRVEDAIERVQSIGRVNKKPVPTALIEKFRKSTITKPEDTSSSSILEVLKRPVLRRLLICMCVVYMCCMIIFDSLVRSIGQLQFDFFLSFTVVSLTEFPSLILVSFILDITGRKLLTLVTFSVSCVFSLLTAFAGNGLASVLCAVAARFATNMACNISMQWAAECLPTPVRGSGCSIVHICGYVATVISPFVVYLGVYVEWLPLVIVSLVAALGALVALGLPETAGREMPHTFEDAEAMVRGQVLLELPRRKGHVNEPFEIN